MPLARFAFGSCFQVRDDPRSIYLDHKNVHDPKLLPKILYNSTSSILQNATYCTWILVKVGKRFEVFGSETLTSTEIGSKHRDLYFDLVENPDLYPDSRYPVVYAAGECHVIRTAGNVNVQYNFDSGTFMKDIMEQYSKTVNSAKPAPVYYGDFMQLVWSNAGATNVRLIDTSILPRIPSEMSKKVVEMYRAAGYIPYSFSSMDTCNRYSILMKPEFKQEYDRIKKQINDIFESEKAKGYPGDFDTWLTDMVKANPSWEYLQATIYPPIFTGGSRRRRRQTCKKMKITRKT
jgi:hypothetical protein